MNTRILFFLTFILFKQVSFGQKVDSLIFRNLLKANETEFMTYAKSVGLQVESDTVNQYLFAKTKGLIFAKTLADKGNQYYVMDMMVSTLNKENNKIILNNAEAVEGKKNTWVDDKYLYIEWDLENPITKEMWYKVLIYKRK